MSIPSSEMLWAALAVTLAIVLAILALSREPVKELSLREAVTRLLRARVCVEAGRWHLYYSKSSGMYVLLDFNSPDSHYVEEVHGDLSEAVDRFIEASGLE